MPDQETTSTVCHSVVFEVCCFNCLGSWSAYIDEQPAICNIACCYVPTKTNFSGLLPIFNTSLPSRAALGFCSTLCGPKASTYSATTD